MAKLMAAVTVTPRTRETQVQSNVGVTSNGGGCGSGGSDGDLVSMEVVVVGGHGM